MTGTVCDPGLCDELDALAAALRGEPRAPRGGWPSAALDAVCALFGLSRFERSLLVLCAGVELHAAIGALCSKATAHGQPTFGLALAILPEPHWSALSPAAPLRHWRLLRLAGDGPLTGAPLRIEERILHLLAGVAHLDAGLDGIAREITPADRLAPTHAAAAQRASVLIAAEHGAGRWPLVQLCGRQPRTRLEVAAHAAQRCGMRLLHVDGEALPAESRATAELQRLCAREAALCAAAIMLEPGDAGVAAVRFADRLEAPLLIACREPLGAIARGTRVDVDPASVGERRQLWRTALGDRHADLNGTLDALVAQFDLDPVAVRAASAEALHVPDADLAGRVWQACRVRARPELDDLAQRIVSPARWLDLVLPAPQRRTLEEIAAQVRRRARVYQDWGFARTSARGLGIAALFAGASGTGKTLAAEVLANELEIDLYRIDLSQVVSKYIGETEKNLRRVFDAAECGGAMLLFDEADALFGKRTEVKDSHDRFANIEISYLLQRMEAYSGLAVLTTNQRSALDDAFLRRLRFVVEFPFPARAERAAIWQRAFPDRVPVADLDRARLSQLAVPGANIRNIALGAAFLAADEDASVRMEHLLRATRSEYAKLDRPLSAAELEGWE